MNNPEVVMIGLGYIGLPTAALIAQNETFVHGVDINPKVVETINKGQIHIVEPELDIAVANAVKKGFLKASTKPIQASTYLVVVPTPFKAKNEPDISFVESATKAIIPLLKEDDYEELIALLEENNCSSCLSHIQNAYPNMFTNFSKKWKGKTTSLIERIMRTVNLRVNVGKWSTQGALNVIKIRLAYYYNGFNPQLKNGVIAATRLTLKDC